MLSVDRGDQPRVLCWPMDKHRTLIHGLVFTVIVLITVGALSCSDGGAGSMFDNPGLEDGEDAWEVLDGPGFQRVTDQARSGEASALVQLKAAAEDSGTGRSHLLQDLEADDFPQALSGFFRVENWTKGTEAQFVQVSVIVFSATNLGQEFPNHQIHYILTGSAPDPSPDTNIRNVRLGDEEPIQNQWIRFQADLSKDFTDLWGAEPDGFELIRVIFEVRYDDKEEGSTPPRADVYFDDLYVGPPLE